MHAILIASVVACAGYFTSRPTSKGWIRSSTSFLQAARQLEILTSKGNAPSHRFLQAIRASFI
jgi:hypothetical protein